MAFQKRYANYKRMNIAAIQGIMNTGRVYHNTDTVCIEIDHLLLPAGRYQAYRTDSTGSF